MAVHGMECIFVRLVSANLEGRAARRCNGVHRTPHSLQQHGATHVTHAPTLETILHRPLSFLSKKIIPVAKRIRLNTAYTYA